MNVSNIENEMARRWHKLLGKCIVHYIRFFYIHACLFSHLTHFFCDSCQKTTTTQSNSQMATSWDSNKPDLVQQWLGLGEHGIVCILKPSTHTE